MSDTVWGALRQTADDATKPLDAGRYRFIVQKADAVKAQTGAPMIKVTVAVQGGPKHGKTLNNNFVLTMDNGFALAMFFRHMTAFGLDDNFFAQLPNDVDASMPILANALVGRQADADVGIRKDGAFAGRNEFAAWYPATGGAPSVGPSVGAPSGGLAGPGVPTTPGVQVPQPGAAPAAAVPTPTATPVVPTPVSVPTIPAPQPPASTVPPPPGDPF